MKIKIPPQLIETFVEDNFPEVRKTVSGELHFNSPFVTDKRKRLYINPEKNRYFDQKQQIGGDFIDFLKNYYEVDEKEAVSILVKEYSSRNSKKDIQKEIIEKSTELELPKGLHFFDEERNTRSEKLAKRYLLNRGISLDGLGYIYDPNGDFKETFHNRIFIPFYENGELVYYITRSFDGSKLRYKNPSNIDRTDIVFNYDKLKSDVFIFEGVMDALSLGNGQVGTASLTSVLSEKQIIKILDLSPERVIIVPDNDEKPSTKEIIERNLEKNLKNFMLYKPESLTTKFYIFRLPKGIKDFNQYVLETGKDFININECELYNPRKINMNMFKWNSSRIIV